jgi:hypothetical protein
MKEVYDENFNIVGYRAKTLKVYTNEQNTVCGLCRYPYELIKIRRIRKAFAPARYAIVCRHHVHSSDSTVSLIVVRYINDDEVDKFLELEYDELIKELKKDP